jgi:hypothetical protein
MFLCACLSAHAQLRAERKALRVFSKRILPNIDRNYFFEDTAASAQVIYYDGTVDHLVEWDWNSRPKHKDERGISKLHWQIEPDKSATRRARARLYRITQYAAYLRDFDYNTMESVRKMHYTHNLRQRDSLSHNRLPIPRPLKRVPSAYYQQLGTEQKDQPTGMFLTVHRALVGQHYIIVELTAARSAECYKNNIPIIVVLRRYNLRLVDWWYIKGSYYHD